MMESKLRATYHKFLENNYMLLTSISEKIKYRTNRSLRHHLVHLAAIRQPEGRDWKSRKKYVTRELPTTGTSFQCSKV